MSGLEIVAFIAGVFGPLQQAIQVALLVKQQFEQCSENKQVILSTLATYRALESCLQLLSEQCINNSQFLSQSSWQVFHHDITAIQNSLQRAMLSLRALESKRSSHSAFLRFFRAACFRDICRRLMKESLLLSRYIDRCQRFTFMCETYQHIATAQSENLASHIQFIAECQHDRVVTDVERLAAKIHAAVPDKLNARDFHVPWPNERFIPSFRIEQSANSKWLAFDAVDKHGFPDTSESQFKRAILRNSIERLRGSCRSPVIGAIGALGIGSAGKSAILRGLARDSNIRNHFSGGLHFISLGLYASEGDVIKEMARIVRRTGGIYVANEMKAADSLVLALGMAKSWFKGKSSLFLVCGVWPIAVCTDIFALLTRLPRDCGRGSVIAATSTCGLKEMESTVLFHPRDGKLYKLYL